MKCIAGSAKAKKMEHVGSESRASTPSKDSNQSQPSTGASSAPTSTPVTATQSKTKNDGSTSSSSSATTSNNTSITTTTSRSNRKSTQSATAAARPSTPSADKKEDATAADNTEEEAATPTAPPPPKAKRMSSQNSNSERSSLSGNGIDAATSQQSTTAAAATTTTSTPTTATTTTAVADAPCVESEETYTAKLEVKIKIPDELKHYLTDDWYAIVREHKLLELPAKVTVQQIADQYLAHKKSVKSTNASKEVAINDVLDGIIEYFNVMLGSQLLYKFERTQYADIMQKNPDTPLSELYGSFHLLRLFVRLGSMLSYSALDQPAMQTLLAHLHDFLKFLVKNSAMYFNMTNFINVDPEYVRNAQ